MWVVFNIGGPSAVIGSLIEAGNMERNSGTDQVISYADEENVVTSSIKLASEFLRKGGRSPRTIGLERELIPLGLYEEIATRFPDAIFVEIGDIIADLRIIKSPEELRLLTLGAEIAKLGANAFVDAIHENCTELEVAAHAVHEMNRALAALYPNGATSTYSYAHFGEHTATPHNHPTGRRLCRGEVFALNVFPVIWGYCMELERTFIFGSPDAKQVKALAAVNEAFEAGKKAIGPGVPACDIDKLTRRMLIERGYESCLYHGTGHAHGIMIGSAGREENGELRLYNTTVLKPNMINSVEPAVFTEGVAFRHSDVMLITDDGARCLTEFPRDLVYG